VEGFQARAFDGEMGA